MRQMEVGRYHVRAASSAQDFAAAHALRRVSFRAGGDDGDSFDHKCSHILVEQIGSGTLVCCFRIQDIASGAEIDNSYSAQYYELSPLYSFDRPILELGRFCIHPDHTDPDILRAAWAALTAHVDEVGAELLFGCSSFAGIEEADYLDAFSLLKDRHLAPKRWLPHVKAPRTFPFAHKLRLRKPDLKAAMKAMPPLLRSYLLMGGWVSDHAVIDRDLNTLHVFTGLEINAIPPARARLLRAIVPVPTASG
ncbi:MAG: GNAT family N-acyltransferase [Pseudomonadota bacterium]